MINLKSFQRTQVLATPDLLPYALLIEPGIILNKDASYMASFFYTAADEASMTAHDRNIANDRLNKALRRFGSGWVVHANAFRQKSDIYPKDEESAFPDWISQLIDEERRGFFESEGNSFETVTTLTLTFTPEAAAQKKMEAMFYNTEGGEDKGKLKKGDKTLFEFKKRIQEFEENASLSLKLNRMANIPGEVGGVECDFDEQLSLIDATFHQTEFRKLMVPACGMFLDSYIGRYQFVTGVTPKIGERYIKVINIDGFPSHTHAGVLNALSELNLEFRWNTRFIPLDGYHAKGEIAKYTRKWSQKVKGFIASLTDKPNAKLDHTALGHSLDAQAAEGDAGGDEVCFGYYTGVIVIMHEDQEFLETASSAMRKALLQLGMSNSQIEDINAVEAWLGSLCGNSFANIRRPLIHSLNLADILPTSSVYAGKRHNPCPFYPKGSPPMATVKTEGATPFRLNLHVSDLAHTLIFGPTGSGKSTLLAFLTTQMLRYKDANIFAFDKGLSMYPVNQAMGGNHYNIGGETEEGLPTLSFAPLSRIDSEQDFEWACEWVQTLVALQVKNEQGGVTVEQKIAIRDAMGQHRRSEKYRSLADFRTQVQDEGVKAALSFYSDKEIYNANEDSLATGHFEVFEIEDLMNFEQEISLPIMLYLFRTIEKRLTGQPAYIIIDEAWLVLGHELFRSKIREWLKVLRKANCGVVLATQSISDAVNSGILDVLVESCPTKIFLPNDKANHEEFANYYRSLGLNTAQRRIVADSVPKKQYFVTSSNGDRLIELALGDLALAFCAHSSKKDLAEINRLQIAHGGDWPKIWVDQLYQ